LGCWREKNWTKRKYVKVSVIMESKKKLPGAKEAENYAVIYTGVNRHTRGQAEVTIWIHKSISNRI
jgi:hypothetical protein